MNSKRLFVSFDYDHDADLKMLLVGQSELPDSPFNIADASVKEALPGDWKQKVRGRISRADVVCVLCTTTTHTAKGVEVELGFAKELDIPYFLLKGYKDKACTRPVNAAADKMYNWTWDNLKLLIHGNR